ncbi:MAG: hypothetical protein WBF53_10185 [Litorimonas sp.]
MTRPLILDVDGTLLKNDLTHEMILEAVKRDPTRGPGYLLTGLRDKPRMKQDMLDRIRDRLLRGPQPLEPEIVALARATKADGREVYLCSGSEAGLVRELAERHDFIDGAFGTSPTYNMTSENKAAFLLDQFPEGFDYAGNSTQDFAVWEAAQSAYAIRPPAGTELTRTAADESVEILIERPSLSEKLPLVLAGLEIWKLLTILLPLLIVAVLLGLNATQTFWLILAVAVLFLAANVERMLRRVQSDRIGGSAKKGNPVAGGLLSVPLAVIAYLVLAGTGLFALSLLTPWLALAVVSVRVLFWLVSPILKARRSA